MTLSDTTTARLRAVIVAVTPVTLLVAFVWHEYIPGRLPNDAAVAEAVVAGTTRWGLAHLAAGVAFGMVVLAFVAIRGYLREASGEGWSALGLPFIVIGSALYTMLPGMEFTPLAAAGSGGDPEAVQAALQPWFLSVLMAGGILFMLGSLCFAAGVARSTLLSRRLAWLVIGALVVMAVSRLVPLAVAQLYLQGVAGVFALWPLSHQMWRAHPRPASGARPLRADVNG